MALPSDANKKLKVVLAHVFEARRLLVNVFNEGSLRNHMFHEDLIEVHDGLDDIEKVLLEITKTDPKKIPLATLPEDE